jgi:hypothetical protein
MTTAWGRCHGRMNSLAFVLRMTGIWSLQCLSMPLIYCTTIMGGLHGIGSFPTVPFDSFESLELILYWLQF